MAQEINYAETTIDRLTRILKDWDNSQFFRRWIYGDDSDVIAGIEDMPCIIISLMGTDIQQGPTGRDEMVETVKINLILNRSDYQDTYDDDTVGVATKTRTHGARTGPDNAILRQNNDTWNDPDKLHAEQYDYKSNCQNPLW
jgi:hypothetical protein